VEEELDIELKDLKSISFEKGIGGFLKKYSVPLLLLIMFLFALSIRLPTMNEKSFIEPDSFWHYRFAKDIVETGTLPSWDNMSPWPGGRAVQPEDLFMSTMAASLYNGVKIFLPDMSLMRFLFWFTPIMAALTVFPTFIIGRELYDTKAGLFAALFFSTSISYLTRTMAGIFDTDSMVLLLPLLTIAFFLLAYNRIDKDNIFKKEPIIYGILCGIFMAAFAMTWNGFWYVFWLLFGFTILQTLYTTVFVKGEENTTSLKEKFVKEFPNIKPFLMLFVLVFIVFSALTVPFIGFRRMPDPMQVYAFTHEFKAGRGIYPSVWETVAEMQTPTNWNNEMANRIGQVSVVPLLPINIPLHWIAFVGLGILGFYTFYKRKYSEAFFLLLIWLIGPILPSLQASRFLILFTAPVALTCGIIFSMLWDQILKYSEIKIGDINEE